MPGSINFEIRIAQDTPLHLDIPLYEIAHFTTAPVRWLRLVGYGTTGVLKPVYESQTMDQPLSLDTPALIAGRTYVYDDPDFDPTVHCLLNLDDIRRHTDADDDSSSSATVSTTSAEQGKKSRIPPYRLRPVEDRDAAKCVYGMGAMRDERVDIIRRELGWNSDYIWRLAAVRHFSFGAHLDIRNGISLYEVIRVGWDNGYVYILAADERFMRDVDVPQPLGQHRRSAPNWPTGRTASNPPIILQFSPTMAKSTHECLACTHRHQERAAFAGTPLGDDEPCPEALHYIYAGGMLLRYLREDEKSRLRGIVLPDVPAFKYDDSLWQKDTPVQVVSRRRSLELTQREQALNLQLGISKEIASMAVNDAKRCQADDAVRTWLSGCEGPGERTI